MAHFRLSHLTLHLPLFLAGSALLVPACGNESEVDAGQDADAADASDSDSSDNDASDSTDDADGIADVGDGVDAGGAGGGDGDGEPAEIWETLPPGFTASTSRDGEEPPLGGYQLVGLLEDVESPPPGSCANILRAVTRDFLESHPDFLNTAAPAGPNYVLPELGADRKPVLNPATSATSLIEEFGDWYNNVAVNTQYVVDLWLQPVGDTFVFSSGLYFPLDGEGPETHLGHGDIPHNFLFTTELHTSFKFKGTETFRFQGDDDVYVFVNGKLAVDLGGVHGIEDDTFDLGENAEDYGLEVGKTYPLDLFHAERKPKGSNFRIETTLDFTECGEILPGDVIK